MKKMGLIIAGIAFSLVCAISTPSKVQAMGMPCTEAEMAKAQSLINDAKQKVAVATEIKNQAEANYNAIAKTNASELEKLTAYNDFVNKNNQLAGAIFWQSEMQKYYDNAYSRGWSEQYNLNMRDKWAGRVNVDTLNTAAINKQDIANSALLVLNNLKAALAVQTEMAKNNAGLQANVNALTAQVAQAEADYQAKLAAAQAAQAECKNAMTNTNWATNGDNDAYFSYVVKCINATDIPHATEHDIMCWYD